MCNSIMKKLLFIIILFVYGCKGHPINEITLNNNLSNTSKAIDTTDYFDDVEKIYEVNINSKEPFGRELLEIEDKWRLEFKFIELNNKKYIFPYSMLKSSNYTINGKYFFEEKCWIDIYLEENENIVYELNICYINTVKDKNKSYRKARNSIMGKDVFEGMEEVLLNKLNKDFKIRIDIENIMTLGFEPVELCKTFKIYQNDLDLIIEEKKYDIEEWKNFFEEDDNIEITENGNILDTLKISEEIWKSRGIKFLE